MLSPFQDALLAIEIAVEALHKLAPGSHEAQDALAQIQHLGFETTPPEQAKPAPKSFMAKVGRKDVTPSHERKLKQKTLF